MDDDAVTFRSFVPADLEQVIELWRACGLTRSWIDPQAEVNAKCAEDPEGLIIAVIVDEAGTGRVVGTVMAGYDGHRGWVNYLGVHPDWRGNGVARRLMEKAEAYLRKRGAPKINLQVRRGNEGVLAFYARLGYVDDDVVGLGKRMNPPS